MIGGVGEPLIDREPGARPDVGDRTVDLDKHLYLTGGTAAAEVRDAIVGVLEGRQSVYDASSGLRNKKAVRFGT